VRRLRNRRGGLLLDGVLAVILVLLGSYALYALGFTFAEILHGSARFFGF
jgi:hypothetical protein